MDKVGQRGRVDAPSTVRPVLKLTLVRELQTLDKMQVQDALRIPGRIEGTSATNPPWGSGRLSPS
jgi:hypothetical protein